ncbi:Cupin [Paenibacillus sp. P1XP2]|nr:Cupin [Paenibacillus sp. P1XP2]
MAVDLTSPSLNLSADSNEVVTYRRDWWNYITQLFSPQLPAAETGFFNIRMSRGVMITPHWHTNSSEMVVVIAGEVTTSVFNPNTQRLMTYRLGPGKVAQFPKGWFHWIVSLTDDTFIMAIFDRPNSDIVYAADFLRFTPKEIMGLAYGVNPEEFAQTVARSGNPSSWARPSNPGIGRTFPAFRRVRFMKGMMRAPIRDCSRVMGRSSGLQARRCRIRGGWSRTGSGGTSSWRGMLPSLFLFIKNVTGDRCSAASRLTGHFIGIKVVAITFYSYNMVIRYHNKANKRRIEEHIMKRIAVIGSSGGNLYNLGGKDPDKLVGEIAAQCNSAGMELGAVQFIAASESMDTAKETTSAVLYGWNTEERRLAKRMEGTLKEVNEAAFELDAIWLR